VKHFKLPAFESAQILRRAGRSSMPAHGCKAADSKRYIDCALAMIMPLRPAAKFLRPSNHFSRFRFSYA
jgi:hypothetical protein